MKKKMNIRAMLAVFMSVCMLGTVTACGDSDNDDKGTERESSSAYSEKDNKKSSSDSKKSSKKDDNDDDKKDNSKDTDDKEKQANLDSEASNIYMTANAVLADMEDEGKMSDIINSSDQVIICSDKSKNVNASGLDSGFYDSMHSYFSNSDDLDWFIVVNKGACEYAACTESGSKLVGQRPSDSYSGKSYDEIYNAVK